jgi:hypothetical protein
MRRCLGLAALLLACGPATAQAALQELSAGAGKDGWRFVGLPHKPEIPATRFETGQAEGVAGVRVSTRSSYGAWKSPAGILQWRWRLDQALSGGVRAADIQRKDGDDAALKVCVLFDHPLDRVPLGERALLRLARALSAQELPTATVCYVWDPAQAREASGSNPYTRRVRYLVLQGQGAPLQRWVSESRNLAADFARLFGDELPPGSAPGAVPWVSAVLIGADSDNTQADSSGWVAQLGWRP